MDRNTSSPVINYRTFNKLPDNGFTYKDEDKEQNDDIAEEEQPKDEDVPMVNGKDKKVMDMEIRNGKSPLDENRNRENKVEEESSTESGGTDNPLNLSVKDDDNKDDRDEELPTKDETSGQMDTKVFQLRLSGSL